MANMIDAYKLFQEGTLAFAEMEMNGIRIDTEYLDSAIDDTNEKIKGLENELKETDVWELWQKTYGKGAKLSSGQQMGDVLFDKMGLPYYWDKTKDGRYSTSAETLRQVRHPFTDKFAEMKTYQTAMSVFLKGIKKEICQGYLHPSFNLNMVITYRSSSSQINFQNQPKRNKLIMYLIRRSFIPREGRKLIEVDFSGAEVSIACCYHRDPVMIRYLKNPKENDMHRDVACDAYMLTKEDVIYDKVHRKGMIRHSAKNRAVFPMFYGSYFKQTAPDLWDNIGAAGLVDKNGVCLYENLKNHGITELGSTNPQDPIVPGTFIAHMKDVEDVFWNQRFKIYAQWKRDWHDAYLRDGEFRSLTGFRYKGFLQRNDVINYPVQGSAFHGLLQSLIWVMQEIKRRGMKTLIIGQIHDSMLADVPVEEEEEYLAICHDTMTRRLPTEWDWINVPISIEAEGSTVSWADCEEIQLAA